MQRVADEAPGTQTRGKVFRAQVIGRAKPTCPATGIKRLVILVICSKMSTRVYCSYINKPSRKQQNNKQNPRREETNRKEQTAPPPPPYKHTHTHAAAPAPLGHKTPIATCESEARRGNIGQGVCWEPPLPRHCEGITACGDRGDCRASHTRRRRARHHALVMGCRYTAVDSQKAGQERGCWVVSVVFPCALCSVLGYG